MVHETLAAAMSKISPILVSFMTDMETKVHNCVSLLQSVAFSAFQVICPDHLTFSIIYYLPLSFYLEAFTAILLNINRKLWTYEF